MDDELSPEAEAEIARQRARCAQLNAEHEHITYFSLTDADIEDLASGYVSASVRARCRFALDTAENDRRMAERPVRKPRTKKDSAA